MIILRPEYITDIIILFVLFVELLVTDFQGILPLYDFALFDSFFSILIILSLPVICMKYRRNFQFLYWKLDFTNVVILLLCFACILAPIITNNNPEFQQNLKTTKLLSPLSEITVLHLKSENPVPVDKLEKFVELKNKVIKRSFDDKLLFVDSVRIASVITYFQKGKGKTIPEEELLVVNDKPLITSKIFFLGTDQFGRDIFSRLITGARISLFVGLSAVLLSLIIGLSLGFLAGYYGGYIDIVLNRIAEMFLAFPLILLIMLFLALFGNSLLLVVGVLGLSSWMSLFKIVRSEVLSIKTKDFFITAKFVGMKKRDLLGREIIPLILAPVVVSVVLEFGNVILTEAALSYLGLGTGSNYPSWGGMIQSGQEYLTKAWWMLLFPGIMLVITLLSANNLGRRLNKFYNPMIQE